MVYWQGSGVVGVCGERYVYFLGGPLQSLCRYIFLRGVQGYVGVIARSTAALEPCNAPSLGNNYGYRAS